MSPEDRVAAYIADWYKCWQANVDSFNLSFGGPADSSAAFDQWHRGLREVEERHWIAGAHGNGGGSFGGTADHDPEVETIIRSEIDADKAVVDTEKSGFAYPRFEEYLLEKTPAGDWRIASVIGFYDPDTSPPFTEAQRQALLEQTSRTASLEAIPARHSPNCAAMFEEGRLVKGSSMREPDRVVVEMVGKISIASGALIIRDLGYDPPDALPLSLRVAPGVYPVEVSRVGRRIAAVRIVFNEADGGPSIYRLASTVAEGSANVGVDAGNVALADADAYLRLTNRSHARVYDAFSKSGRDPFWAQLSGAAHGEHDCVVVSSGYGDGCYPAYWVLNSQEQPVAVVVDFLVMAENLTQKIRLPWTSGCDGELASAELTERGVKITVERRANELVACGPDLDTIHFLSPDGEAVWRGEDSTRSVGGDQTHWNLDLKAIDQRASHLEVSLHNGYRN
jgi:hypothetical protein